jgi:hypothetical protein
MSGVPLFGVSDDSGHAGVNGFSAVADGTRGDTHASAKNGVVGTNDSTEALPAGVPGGNRAYDKRVVGVISGAGN